MLQTFWKLCEKLASLVGDKTQFGETSANNDMPLLEEGLAYHALNRLLPYHSYDPDTNIYYNKKSAGFMLEICPMLGASEEQVNILASIITDVLPQQVDLQFILWGSPKIGELLDRFEQR